MNRPKPTPIVRVLNSSAASAGIRSPRELGAAFVAAVLLCAGGCAREPRSPIGEPFRSPPGRAGAVLVGPVRTIVLDAGHGGHDPGAIYHGLREKQLTLDIARRLRTFLERDGFTVVMTREGDQFIPLSGRAGLANRLQADLFVSIHLNANTNGRVFGAEVYYPRESVVAPSAQWPPYLASSEVGVPSAVVKQVLWDLVLRRTRAQSFQLASAIASTLQQGLQVPSKVKAARFVVLREVWMPAVLVEVGYVSNYHESQRLNAPAYREAAAQAVAGGILAYVRQLGAQHI